MQLSSEIKHAFSRTLKTWSIDGTGYSMVEIIIAIIFATIAIPGIVGMYTAVLTNSHSAEIMTVANLLAVEQMETILADKAGTGVDYGYSAINSQKYASVTPTSPFTGYSRTVDVQTIDSGQTYEYKLITVTVGHSLIPEVVLVSFITDHSGI